MLQSLLIKNIALINNTEIFFSSGLNVLSGETGAGKSVILESLNFVLGAKADKTLIRSGESECFVQAIFDVSNNKELLLIFNENDIDFVKDTIELSYLVSQCRFKRILNFSDFVELVSGASLGIVGTCETFKHYLKPSEFNDWENDLLDMSKMKGYKKGLCDIYLQADSLYKAYKLILKFCDIQDLLEND